MWQMRVLLAELFVCQQKKIRFSRFLFCPQSKLGCRTLLHFDEILPSWKQIVLIRNIKLLIEVFTSLLWPIQMVLKSAKIKTIFSFKCRRCVKINKNFKILLSYWPTFKFWSNLKYWYSKKKKLFKTFLNFFYSLQGYGIGNFMKVYL